MTYVKLASTTNRHENWTAGFILEKDSNGDPTKIAELNVPIDLSVEEIAKLESLGAQFATSSAEEAKAYQARLAQAVVVVGSDVAAAAPVIAAPVATPVAEETPSKSGSKSDDK